MFKSAQKNQRAHLSLLIVVCMGIILCGGFYYISSLRSKLMDQAIHNVFTVTVQQQQAFDNFLSGDRERVHSFAQYVTKSDSDDTLPIIAMTANAFVEDIRATIESGMDAHIAKPIHLGKLKDTIQEVFDRGETQGIKEGEDES